MRERTTHAAAVCAAVGRASLAERLAYRGDVALSAAMGIARVLLALLLWSAVFAGRAEVGGMSLELVASYYLVAVFAFQLDQSSSLAFSFAGDIRAGLFAKYLAKPVDPLLWFLASCAGRTIFQAVASVAAALGAAAVLALIAGGSGTALLASIEPLGILAALVALGLGLVALALVNFMTAILAFRFQDIGAFHMAKNNLVEFLSGALIPLAMLPEWLRRDLSFTPFPALASLPADLALGKGWAELPQALALLALWDAGLFVAAKIAFARLSDRYEELGS